MCVVRACVCVCVCVSVCVSDHHILWKGFQLPGGGAYSIIPTPMVAEEAMLNAVHVQLYCWWLDTVNFRHHFYLFVHCRFFIDRTPGEQFAAAAAANDVDQVRISQRAHRFSQGVDGNRKFKAKLSLNDLIKSAVRKLVYCDFCVV